MPQTFNRDRFTWLAYMLLAFYAYYINVLGPITPYLKDELNLSYTVGSLHYTAFAVGMLCVGLAGHVVIEALGRWRSLWLGALGLSLGVFLLISGRTEVITIGAAFLMGSLGSLTLAIVPSALADLHGEHSAIALSEANVVASLVSVAAPLMVGRLADLVGGWRVPLAIVALAPLALRLGFGKVAVPAAASAAAAAGAPGKSAASAAAKKPLPAWFWVYWAAIVLAVSVEFCLLSWSADYLEKNLGMLQSDAAQAVGLFMLGMILGRLAGSRLVQRFSAHTLVIGSAGIAMGGFLLFWLSGQAALGLAGLLITGLGVASLYPLILSLAMNTAKENTVQASARTTLASGTAILALPLTLGRLADAFGIQAAYGVVLALLVCVVGVMVVAKRSRGTTC